MFFTVGVLLTVITYSVDDAWICFGGVLWEQLAHYFLSSFWTRLKLWERYSIYSLHFTWSRILLFPNSFAVTCKTMRKVNLFNHGS